MLKKSEYAQNKPRTKLANHAVIAITFEMFRSPKTVADDGKLSLAKEGTSLS